LGQFAEELVALGRDLYTLVLPSLAWVDDYRARGNTPGTVVPRRELRELNWAMWFGPPFVERYGRSFLLGIPGYRTAGLEDGGVYFQLTGLTR
jgi:hypothetical protein